MKHTFSFKKGMAAALVAAVTAVASLPSQMLGFAADAVPAADATWEENLSLLASTATIEKMVIAQNVTYERVEQATDVVADVYDDIMDLFKQDDQKK